MALFFNRKSSYVLFICLLLCLFRHGVAQSLQLSQSQLRRLDQLNSDLLSAKSIAQKVSIIKHSQVVNQVPRLKYLKEQIESPAQGHELDFFQEALSGYLYYYGVTPLAKTKVSKSQIRNLAASIKLNNDYRDSHHQSYSNWFRKFLDKLKFHWPQNKENKKSTPKIGLHFPKLTLGIVLVWAFLGALLLLFATWALLAFSRMKSTKRVKNAIINAEEEQISRSEWIIRAEAFEKSGEFREAVRCYYIAILLRFDEERIARFEPSQTNWHHLKRIEASQNFPRDYDFRSPTTLFDRTWYGKQVNGADDVLKMKDSYTEVNKLLHLAIVQRQKVS